MTGILDTRLLTGGSQSGAVRTMIAATKAMVPTFFQLMFLNIVFAGGWPDRTATAGLWTRLMLRSARRLVSYSKPPVTDS